MNRINPSEELELMSPIVENELEGIVLCKNQGELTYFNQRTRELHGLPVAHVAKEEWPSYYSVYQPGDYRAIQSKNRRNQSARGRGDLQFHSSLGKSKLIKSTHA